MSSDSYPPSDASRLNDDLHVSPDTVLSVGGGEVAQQRFDYQNTYACLLAIQMYANEIPCTEILCEYLDDILGKRTDGKFVGIQIKTRGNKNPFSINHKEVKESIKHFVGHEKRFPDSFEEFIIITNCGTLNTKQDTQHISDLSSIDEIAFSEEKVVRRVNKFFQDMEKNYNRSKSHVVRVVRKLKFLDGPGLEDIEPKIIGFHLANLPEINDKSISLENIKEIFRAIKGKIYEAATRRFANSVADYEVFVNDSNDEKFRREINAKHITKSMISDIIRTTIRIPPAKNFQRIRTADGLRRYYQISSENIVSVRASLLKELEIGLEQSINQKKWNKPILLSR